MCMNIHIPEVYIFSYPPLKMSILEIKGLFKKLNLNLSKNFLLKPKENIYIFFFPHHSNTLTGCLICIQRIAPSNYFSY